MASNFAITVSLSPHIQELSGYPEEEKKSMSDNRKKAATVLGKRPYTKERTEDGHEHLKSGEDIFVVTTCKSNISKKKLHDYGTQMHITQPPFIYNYSVKVRASITKYLRNHMDYYELLCFFYSKGS